MLDSVKRLIAEPVVPFEERFVTYIMQVQDANIDAEFKHLLNRSQSITPVQLCRMIDKEMKKVGDLQI